MDKAAAITKANEESAIENNKLLMKGDMQCFSNCIYIQIVSQMLDKRGGLICISCLDVGGIRREPNYLII